jgi:hypothetical protein
VAGKEGLAFQNTDCPLQIPSAGLNKRERRCSIHSGEYREQFFNMLERSTSTTSIGPDYSEACRTLRIDPVAPQVGNNA